MLLCTLHERLLEAYRNHAILLAMLMDPTDKPPVEYDILVTNLESQISTSPRRGTHKSDSILEKMRRTQWCKRTRGPTTARAFAPSVEA